MRDVRDTASLIPGDDKMCLVNEHRFKLLTFMLRGAREGIVSNIEVSAGMAFIPFRSSTWKKG